MNRLPVAGLAAPARRVSGPCLFVEGVTSVEDRGVAPSVSIEVAGVDAVNLTLEGGGESGWNATVQRRVQSRKRPAKYTLPPSRCGSDDASQSNEMGAASWHGDSAFGTSGSGWLQAGRVAV